MATVVPVEELQSGKVAALFEGRDHGSSVSIFVAAAPPGAGPRLHRHPYDETFVVQEGVGTFTVDGETIEVGAGQVVVVPAGAAHRFVNSGEDVMRLVTVHPSDHVVQEVLD